MRYVIIGNSAGAVGTVEGIRQVDKNGEITIISNEPYHTYSRPLISYLLLGKTTEEKMKYRGDNFYTDNKCKLLLSKTVLKIDADKKEVVLDDKTSVPYDKLLVSTGSSAFVPPMEGLDSVEKKFTFLDLDSAKELEKSINKDSRVLIIGAGLIGLKCAEGIYKSVANIKVVDLAPKVLSSILDDDVAVIVKNHLEGYMDFYLGDSVKSFNKNVATLNSGKEIEFDVLVLAVGVKPNVDLVKSIGGEVSRGIVVNSKMETSVSDIYAAGDATDSLDISSGQRKVLALLPNAYMQGECAGINMAGGECEFNKAIPMNAIGFFGLHIITAGSYIGDTYTECEGNNYKKLFYSDNLLKGYIITGNVEKAGIYTSLIRDKVPLDTIDFELICRKPGLMAFSRETRAEKLGSKR